MNYLDYELMVGGLLEKQLRKNNQQVEVRHQQVFSSSSGNSYNIDLSYEMEMMGFKYLTIIECKYWNTNVNREKVAYVKAIIDDLKAQKGIVVTSKGFQSGAIQFAKSNNIGLLVVTNTKRPEMVSHFDGGLHEIEESLGADQEVRFGKQVKLTGLFGPAMSISQFIGKYYSMRLARFLQDEYSPAMLDSTEFDPEVKYELFKLPKNWSEVYVEIETAGLCYGLVNANELRALSIQIGLLKAQLQP